MPPPTHLARDPIEVRTGQHVMRPAVTPRADDRPRVCRPRRDETHDRVSIAVLPSTDHEHRRRDRVRVNPDRAVSPVLISRLMGEPGRDDGFDRLEPLEPSRSPRLANDVGVGRRDEEEVSPRGPELHVVAEDIAAHVVDVVRVAIVGRARADHSGERGRTQRCDLQRVEPAPRQSAQPDPAVAPRLCSEPRDHVDSVLQLGGEVLVVKEAVGVATARDRDAEVGDSGAGERAPVRRVDPAGEPLVRIRVEAENRTDRFVTVGSPHARVEPAAVGQRDPDNLLDHGTLAHATMVP